MRKTICRTAWSERPYKLFDVVAYDVVDGRLAVEKTIYYRNDAGTLTRYYNPELTADTLLPDKAGDYVIRYAASNSDGKRAVYDFTVEVRERADTVDLEFEKELPDRLRTGERFELGSYRTVGTSASQMCAAASRSTGRTYRTRTEYTILRPPVRILSPSILQIILPRIRKCII